MEVSQVANNVLLLFPGEFGDFGTGECFVRLRIAQDGSGSGDVYDLIYRCVGVIA